MSRDWKAFASKRTELIGRGLIVTEGDFMYGGEIHDVTLEGTTVNIELCWSGERLKSQDWLIQFNRPDVPITFRTTTANWEERESGWIMIKAHALIVEIVSAKLQPFNVVALSMI